MNDFNLNPDPTSKFFCSPVAAALEECIKQVSHDLAKVKSDWLREFISVLLAKNDISLVETQEPNGSFTTRIVSGGIIIGSFTVANYRTADIYRNPDFYETNQ